MSWLDRFNFRKLHTIERSAIHEDELDRLHLLLVGQSVEVAGPDELILSNGTRVGLAGNLGCAGCGSGSYYLEELNGVGNVITNVEVVREDGKRDTTYRLFVIADNEKINLATFEGDDGNGYYGTGFWVAIIPEPEETPHE